MYDAAFYDMIRPGCQQSAAVVVPLLMKQLLPRTVIDVGGGEGWWANEFAGHGCDVLLLDGAEAMTGSPLLASQRATHDLAGESFAGVGRFDLALCLEVAEHLPAQRAESFIDELCTIAPVVVFSAAIPGQGGVGHVNEQWPAYWASLFGRCGYAVSGTLRWQIWTDERVENWYRQNLLVAARLPQLWPALFDVDTAAPLPLVHPVLFDARRRR